LSKYIDYDAGTIVLGGVTMHVYIGSHPSIDSLIGVPTPAGKQFAPLYVSPAGNRKTYVRIYGYIIREKYDDFLIKRTVFVRFDVSNNRAGREAVDAVTPTLKRCDVVGKF
jgi:hypothetical protein